MERHPSDVSSTTSSHPPREPNLGYTPFEYWKGPKPVSYQTKKTLRQSIGGALGVFTSSAPAPAAPASPANLTALQPGNVHTAQQLVDSANGHHLQPGTNDMSSRLGRGHGRFDKNGGISLAQMDMNGPPPAYTEISHQTQRTNMGANQFDENVDRWYNPRTWRKRIWAILVAIIVIIIVVVVAVVVTQNKSGAYPNYTNLTYTLSDTYSGETFFDNFNYFHDYDPSSGFVHYVSSEDAARLNLTYASSSTAVVKVDTSVGNTSTPDASTGRFSVRVHSKTQYNSGLFIFDVKHTPYGCATWPALWLTDPDNWPDHGEIDVMETVNQATDGNEVTLHTTDSCSMNHKRKMTGSSLHTNCDHDANNNAGCGVEGDDDTYGETFNTNGGGVMALEWRDEGIRVWQFGRDAIPDDITSGSPVPDTWGTALADFPNTGCDIGSHFKNQSIIVNIDLCGDLTNSVYSSSGCPTNCTDLVANYPDAFTNAYWEFGEFQIYQSS